MVDVTFPGSAARPSRWGKNWIRAGVFLTQRWYLLFALLFALGWSAAQVSNEERDCRTRWGQFHWKQVHWLRDAECRQPQDTLPLGIP